MFKIFYEGQPAGTIRLRIRASGFQGIIQAPYITPQQPIYGQPNVIPPPIMNPFGAPQFNQPVPFMPVNPPFNPWSQPVQPAQPQIIIINNKNNNNVRRY